MANSKVPSTKGGKFVATMEKLAKKRSASRSKAPLQIGNVLTKNATAKGKATFGSKIDKPEGDKGTPVKSTKAQKSLNSEQQ